jgi:hypothetical protein
LESFLYDEKLRKNWQAWAGEYVKNFDYKNVTDQYEAIYKKAVTHHKKVSAA